MAFLGNLSRPVQYNPNAGRSNSEFKRYVDRLITVTRYDTARGLVYGVDKDGKEFEAHVDPQEVINRNDYLRNNPDKAGGANWMGHRIDEDMERHNKVGSKLILVKSRHIKNDRERNLTQVVVERIGGVPNPEEDKTFEGIMTLTARKNDGALIVDRVQHWEPNGIDIENHEALSQLADKMDESSARYGEKIGEYNVTLPTIGVQFRTLMKTDKKYEFSKDGKDDIYQVVDTSIPFEWIPGPLDEHGNEIKEQAHIITGEEMLNYASAYVDYIQNHEVFAEDVEEGLIKIEVCVYHSYPASRNSTFIIASEEALNNEERLTRLKRSPLYQLTHRESYVDIGQSVRLIGKNMAVIGILQIGPNKLVKVNGVPEEIPVYWASRLHVNNYRGHVHAFVRTDEGYKTEPHQNLKLLTDEEAQNQKRSQYVVEDEVGTENQAQPKESQATTSSPQVVDALGAGDDDDFFGQPDMYNTVLGNIDGSGESATDDDDNPFANISDEDKGSPFPDLGDEEDAFGSVNYWGRFEDVAEEKKPAKTTRSARMPSFGSRKKD